MDATAKVSLDSSGYEAGAQKIQAADRETAATAKASFDKAGASASAAFDKTSTTADRATRSIRELREEAQKAGRVLEEAAKKASAPWSNGPDESNRLRAWLEKADSAVRAQRVRQASPMLLPMPAPQRIGVRPEEIKVAPGAANEAGARPMISSMGQMQLMHVGRSLGGSLMAGAPVGRALEMEAPRLLEALGPAALKAAGGIGALSTGLGILTVGAAAVAAGTSIALSERQSNKLRRENDLVGNVGNRRGDTVSELDQEIEDAQKRAHDTRHLRHTKRNQFANLAGDAYSAVGIEGISGTRDADVMDIRGRKLSLRDRRDAAAERDLGFERRAFSGDESAAKDQLRVGMEEKVREIRASMVKDANRLVETERGGYDLAAAKMDRVQKINAENIGLERTLTFLKQQGADVDVRGAEARLASARRVRDLGPTSGAGYAENASRVESASEEVRMTRRTNDERREEYATRVAIAALTERADDRHLMALSLEEQKLRARLASHAYGADEKMGMSSALMDNQAEQREIFRQRTARADEGWLNQRASSYERGYGGQRQGLLDQQTILNGQIERNTAGMDASGQTVFKDANLGAQQLAQAHQLQQTLEEIGHTRERSLKDAAQSVKVADLEARGMRETASIASAIYGWDAKIAEARWNNNEALAGQYEKLKAIAEAQSKLHDFLHPEVRAAERANTRATEQAQRSSDLNGGLLNVTRDGDGTPMSGLDPATGQNRYTTAEERAAARAARRMGPYTGATKARQALGGGIIPEPDLPDVPGLADNQGTPQMFGQTSATAALAGAPNAWDAMAKLRGDPDHDPAARLEKASVFRDFSKPRSAAEENRPNMPAPDPKISALTGQVSALSGLVNKLAAGMDKLASKVGVA